MKKLAKILGGLFALVIVAALVAPAFISSDAIKAQLIAQVKKVTGRTLEISGETSVRLFPNIEVVAEGVSLSNPEGFTTPHLISLKKLATGAQLRPLLRGELRIDGITLEGAVIHLEENKNGAKNWEFTTEKVKETAEEAVQEMPADKKTSGGLKRFALGDVVISDSAVSYIKPSAEVVELKQINLTLSGADATAPLKLEGSAEYRGETVQLALDVANLRAAMDGKTSPILLALTLPGAALDFNGDVAMGDAMRAKGKISLNASALPRVVAWATGKKAAPSLPQQVALKADAAYAEKTLALEDATLRVDDLNASGKLSMNHANRVPDIRGALALGAVDLDGLLKKTANPDAASESSDTSHSPASSPTGWSDAPIKLDGLNAANANLDLTWDSLKTGKLSIGKTALNATLKQGALAITLNEAALYNGGLRGVVKASSTGSMAADLVFSGIDIDALMSAVSGTSRLQGKTNLTLDVRSNGASQRALVQNLAGNGALKVADGAIKGINIGQFLRDAKQGFLFKSNAESTDFTDLTASFNIAEGGLNNKDLAMKSPALRLAGEGSVNLPAKTLNYRLLPTLAQTSKGQGGKDAVAGLTVPLIITGAWSNPSVTPDLAGMVQEGLRDPEALKQNLKNLKEGIKDFNSKDDLKRALLGGGDDAPTAQPATATDATSTTNVAPAASATSTESAPAPAPSKKEQRQKLIQEGIGGLLQGL